MSNLDELIEAARQDHASIDSQIETLRDERRQINTKIKELTVRKVQASRIVRAAQPPQSRKARIDGQPQ